MSTPQFTAKRVSRKSAILLNGAIKDVFPLFGPVREKEWAEGWDPSIVYSTDALIEEHMVFRTPGRYHGQESDRTWVVSKYDPERSLVEYTVFTPAQVYWITIQCRAEKEGRATRAEIAYTFTGLTESGNALIEKAANAMFAHDLKDWETTINHYLATGKMLIHP